MRDHRSRVRTSCPGALLRPDRARRCVDDRAALPRRRRGCRGVRARRRVRTERRQAALARGKPCHSARRDGRHRRRVPGRRLLLRLHADVRYRFAPRGAEGGVSRLRGGTREGARGGARRRSGRRRRCARTSRGRRIEVQRRVWAWPRARHRPRRPRGAGAFAGIRRRACTGQRRYGRAGGLPAWPRRHSHRRRCPRHRRRQREPDQRPQGSRHGGLGFPISMAETVNTNQFKNGIHIELDGDVWRILEFQHVKPGKGGAFVRTKLKSLDSGAVVDRTFRAGEKFTRIRTETKSMQYLYDTGDEVVFMDEDTYEQTSLPHAAVEDALEFMQPSTSVQMLLVNGRPSGVQLPGSVELAVTDTEPGIRGDTVSNVTKPAKLETGAVVQVPLFVNTGDRIKVDPRERRDKNRPRRRGF